VTAPGEVLVRTLVRTEVRPDVAKPAIDPAAGVFERNRSQAIADITGKVKVVPGDSLWKLAVRYFGNGLRWKRLAALNPQLSDPNRIRVGEWIQIPSEHKQSAKHLVVQPGDTLGKSLNPS
jgi:nucleoid-associated protein YgaU